MSTDILFDTLPAADGTCIGVATLNAPGALNALNHAMIVQLAAQLARWRDDAALACVVLRGAGDKAFCAGGDVRALRSALLQDARVPNPAALAFFRDEYALDYAIHTYPKPVVVWGNGIVMGGGLGLMAGASHRVATASTRIAMPEITIGLYPDVAGSAFLSRMPMLLGRFLALTGAPLNACDARLAGLADHLLDETAWPQLLARMQDTHWQGQDAFAELTRLLNALEAARQAPLPAPQVAPRLDAIHALMHHGTLGEIAAALEATRHSDDAWLRRAAEGFASGCPLSAAIALEAQRRARTRSLADVLRMELGLSLMVCAHGDFCEGVRALLIDKDRQPRWQTPGIAELTPERVAPYFASPWPAANHPLAAL